MYKAADVVTTRSPATVQAILFRATCCAPREEWRTEGPCESTSRKDHWQTSALRSVSQKQQQNLTKTDVGTRSLPEDPGVRLANTPTHLQTPRFPTIYTESSLPRPPPPLSPPRDVHLLSTAQTPFPRGVESAMSHKCAPGAMRTIKRCDDHRSVRACAGNEGTSNHERMAPSRYTFCVVN